MKSGQERIQIDQVKVEKHLGVIFDEKLLFREHISKKSAIANRKLGLRFMSFTYLNKEMIMCLYKAPVRPHFGVLYRRFQRHFFRSVGTFGAKSASGLINITKHS